MPLKNLNKYGYSEDGYKSVELIKTTQDDWKPNIDGNKIKVRVSVRPNSTFQIFTVYICAIGASNYRFDLSFETTDTKLADTKYKAWSEFLYALPEEVGKEMFRELGLIEHEN